MTAQAVVDASAIAAVLFGEPRGGEVAAILGERRLLAPTLLRYEVGNVCLSKMRRRPDRASAFLLALALLEELDIEEAQVPANEVVVLADLHGLTAYDASYLWLARATGARLVTLDERLRIARE